MSEQRLLGTGGRDHSHAALRTPGAAQHLHPGVRLCGLDQEGHGDGVEARRRDSSQLPFTRSFQTVIILLIFYFLFF